MSERLPTAAAMKRVLVLSYLNYPNFGDRLGFQIINSLLPANVRIVHAALNYSYIPEGEFDLMILGLGQSLNVPAILRPELVALMDRIPHVIGIFGTQYKYQYREVMKPSQFANFLRRLTCWWARYETDIADFGQGLADARHLGDWLISAFPMTEPRFDGPYVVGPETREVEAPIDRSIQRFQAYRQVSSARLHPLLCAMTAAERVRYQEQRETERKEPSGKFEAMLLDMFGRTFPEDEWFDVDRDAVLRYKLKVEANMAALRGQIVELLG
jgi:hypothetical protein